MLMDVLTIGDGMITMDPKARGPMRFVNEFQRKVGGAELNFAIGASRLGLKTGWISRLGNDEFGRVIHNFMRGEGVDMSQVEYVEGIPTSVYFKEIMEDGSGRSFYYRNPTPMSVLTPEDIKEEHIKNFKLIHLTGVFLALNPTKHLEIVERIIYYAKKHDVKISMDPNIRLRLWSKDKAREVLTSLLPHVNVLLTGEEEGEILLGTTSVEEMIEQFRGYGIDHVVIKKGADGASVTTAEGTLEMAAFTPRKVVDTVGAGDGFDAGYITGYLKDWSVERSLRFANKVGSMVVSVVGDNEGLPYYEDVLAELGERETIER
ncbi:2-dehydro-3-deoxygluconokinase [Evansella vedderi]|uniref:2-dehydro-3-deoxygluconokinase n=1 Tax=Evansella vedderi TaxID=38282 RepID=A0ABU0A0B1_9BACI|nr:sugar kinase [Evansella vedderi]MDQ0256920.1 2-dehydro-3-deoxygluconokinase [Evansella vedderi]